jgi:uncharacterized protein YcbK (DUF882 family)
VIHGLKITVAQAKQLRVDRYADYLNSHGFKYNFPAEIANLAHRKKRGVLNDVPPVELWHMILTPIRVGELLREEFGATLILSAFRTDAYNVAVYHPKKASKSRHSVNDALDGRCERGTPKDWQAFLIEKRAAGVFTGGIGIYTDDNFVHWDNRGVNADWQG